MSQNLTTSCPPKPFKTYPELVDILQQRGMIIEDKARAERKLAQVGYYRLSGFSHPCREIDFDDSGKAKRCPQTGFILRLNSFLPETSFNKVFDLYLFDKRLRQAMLDAIERIEIYIRSIIAHELSYHNAFAYKDSSFINPKWTQNQTTPSGKVRNVWAEWQTRNQDKITRSHDDCILWHTKRDQSIPFWVLIEAWDFGTMSKYFGLLSRKYQNHIAARIGCTNPQEMVTWLKELNTLRNHCAHHARIWNQNCTTLSFTSIPELAALNLDNNARSRLFGQIAILWYLVSQVGSSTNWITHVASIVNQKPDLPNCGFRVMGLPDETGFPLHWFVPTIL